MAKKKAVINQSKCDNSPFCPVMKICPAKAVERKALLPAEGEAKDEGLLKSLSSFFSLDGAGKKKVAIDASKYTGCGACVPYCPHGAVRMTKEN